MSRLHVVTVLIVVPLFAGLFFLAGGAVFLTALSALVVFVYSFDLLGRLRL